jgi:hypothetical protein
MYFTTKRKRPCKEIYHMHTVQWAEYSQPTTIAMMTFRPDAPPTTDNDVRW